MSLAAAIIQRVLEIQGEDGTGKETPMTPAMYADLRRQSEYDLRHPTAHNRRPQQTPMRTIRQRAYRRAWRRILLNWVW